MIYDNNQFLTTEGCPGYSGGRFKGGEKILCDSDRLHKSAVFKWANIICSAALWNIISDSYPSQERGINHEKDKTFSHLSVPSSLPPPPRAHARTHTSPHHTAHPFDSVLCQVCFCSFSCRCRRLWFRFNQHNQFWIISERGRTSEMKLLGCESVFLGGGCVKKKQNGGLVWRGPYPSGLHIFAEATAGAWLTDEWGVQAWQTGRHVLYYYISGALLNIQNARCRVQPPSGAQVWQDHIIFQDFIICFFCFIDFTWNFLLSNRLVTTHQVKSTTSQLLECISDRQRPVKLHLLLIILTSNKTINTGKVMSFDWFALVSFQKVWAKLCISRNNALRNGYFFEVSESPRKSVSVSQVFFYTWVHLNFFQTWKSQQSMTCGRK